MLFEKQSHPSFDPFPTAKEEIRLNHAENKLNRKAIEFNGNILHLSSETRLYYRDTGSKTNDKFRSLEFYI